MAELSYPYYQFAKFRLELRRSLLISEVTTQGLTANTPYRMPKRSFDLLTCLLEQAGTVVDKNAIFERVWLNQAVEDGNLSQQIYLLRRLLEDDPTKPTLILTIPGIGYTFTGKALLITESGALSPSPLEEGSTKWDESGPPLPPRALEEARVPSLDSSGPRSLSSILYGQWPFRLGLLLSVFFVLVLIPLAILLSRTPRLPQPAVTPITSFPGIESHPRFSRDGKLIAFTADPDGKGDQDIYIKLVNLGEPLRITTNPSEEGPMAWSPDGTQLAFLRAASDHKLPSPVFLLPILGGNEKVIGYSTGGLDWSPVDNSIAITTLIEEEGVDGIELLSLDGQLPRVLIRSDPQLPTYYTQLRFSPGGNRLAFIRWRSGVDADLYLLTIATGSLQRLTADHVRINSLQWSRDGNQLFFVSERNGLFQLWKIPTAGGTPSLIPNAPHEISLFDLSPTANQLAYTQISKDSTIAVLSLSGPTQTPRSASSHFPVQCQIDSSREDHSPDISPDGSRMVFMSDRSGWMELWTSTLDCQKLTQLTFFREYGVGSPRWSPDGKRIAFDRHHSGLTDIFSIEVATGIISQHTNHPASDYLPSWSNSGDALYFCSDRSGQSQIWKLQLTSGTLTLVTQNSGFESQESSDGKRLYFTRAKQLWIKDLLTGRESLFPLPNNALLERDWRFVDQLLFYRSSTPSTNSIISRIDLNQPVAKPLFSLPGMPLRHVPGLSVSLDLKFAAISYLRHQLGDLYLLENWN